MRTVIAAVFVIGTTLTAQAQTGPVIVIPGRPGVPVLINGLDASYRVVEGDWGLASRIHVQPIVYNGRPENSGPPVGRYFPSSGRIPGYGRVEIEPPANRPLPREAQSFTRSWSAGSYSPPQAAVPSDPPPIVVAPQINMPKYRPRNGPHY